MDSRSHQITRHLQFGPSSEPGLAQESLTEVRRIISEGQHRPQCPQCGGSLPCIYCSPMENEANRRKSFEYFARQNMPSCYILSELQNQIIKSMARNGFFCNRYGKAECFSCQISANNFFENTDVERFHRTVQHCRFRDGEECGNIPIQDNMTASSNSARPANVQMPSSFATPPREDRDFHFAEGNSIRNGEDCGNIPFQDNITASSNSARPANVQVPSSFATPPREDRDFHVTEGNRSFSPGSCAPSMIVYGDYVANQTVYQGCTAGSRGSCLPTPPVTPNHR